MHAVFFVGIAPQISTYRKPNYAHLPLQLLASSLF
jgi:hypothetical protein